LRAKARKESLETIESLWICAGYLSKEQLKKLYALDSVEEIIRACKIPVDKELQEAIRAYEEGNVAELEDAIDKKYYELLAKSLKSFKGEEKIVKKFAALRLDILNLRTLYRLKKKGMRKEEIMKFFTKTGSISRKELEELASLELEEMHARLCSKFEMLKNVNIKESLGELEAKLEVYLLKFAEKLMHAHPLSIAPLISYAIMKETEARNIKLIARAKYYRVEEEFVRSNLVVI
jgi:vacuolar-type H+-ATPase subunit C/Vma6